MKDKIDRQREKEGQRHSQPLFLIARLGLYR